MTPAQVVDVMGFEGERLESVRSDFRTSVTLYFRESPRKYITVYFNSDHRATSKYLNGLQVITLAKYRSIQTGAATGALLTEVNSIMGFSGIKLPFSSPVEYFWFAGSFHSVTVKFNAGGRAIKKSLRGGFPGMVTLEKYNRIVVGPSRGMNSSDIDRIMGFSGSSRPQRVPNTNTSTYRWAESAEKYIEVEFLGGKASSAKASGLPGAAAKP